MSYQVLARKWRPKGFEEVVGQDHVVRALSNAIEQERLHHAYMFTGTRGVGKTTIARILAKCLNCEAGMTTTPCEKCEACLAVNEGRFVDLIEVDGASRTKVEDTRELLDNVQYAPVQGRIKIYLIDEVHMLSNHSFNALLKTLEEPPAHVKFLLATTDPQKVPITILSRCLQFTLKQLTPEMISDHLAKVLSAEAVQYEVPALLALGKAARGSARDALSLTDQAIAYGGGQITQAQVQSMLGTVHQQALEQVLRALVSQDPATVLQVVDVLVRDGIDIQQLVQDLLGALHRLSLAKSVPTMLNQADEADQSWLGLAQSFSAEALQVYYQIALLGLRDLSWAPDMRAAVEMLLLRMMLFDLQSPTGAPEAVNPEAIAELTSEPAADVGAGNESSASTGGQQAASTMPTPMHQSQSSGRQVPQRDEMTPPQATLSEPSFTQPISQAQSLAQTQSVPQAQPQPQAQSVSGVPSQSVPQAVVKPTLMPTPMTEQVPNIPPHSEVVPGATGGNGLEASAVSMAGETNSAAAVETDSMASGHVPASHHRMNAQPPGPTGVPPVSSVGDQVSASNAGPSQQQSQQQIPQTDQSEQPPVPADLAPWLLLIERAQQGERGLTGPALNLARNCVITQHDAGFLHLAIAPTLRMLLTENAQQRLRDALIALPQANIEQVKIQVSEQQACTPAQWIKQQAALALENAHKALQADPFVQTIQSTFGATVVRESVKPLGEAGKKQEEKRQNQDGRQLATQAGGRQAASFV